MISFLSVCRKIHSWLGFFLMPWILVIGMTGLYLNHSKPILRALGHTEFSRSVVENLPVQEIDQARANQIVASIWPDQAVLEAGPMKYRGVQMLAFKKDPGFIIFPGPRLSFYFVVTWLSERTYAVDGTLVHHQYNLKRIFKSLHERGWASSRFGTWFADTVAVAMVFFGLSGFIMWSVPKVRRLRRAVSQMRRRHHVAAH